MTTFFIGFVRAGKRSRINAVKFGGGGGGGGGGIIINANNVPGKYFKGLAPLYKCLFAICCLRVLYNIQSI